MQALCNSKLAIFIQRFKSLTNKHNTENITIAVLNNVLRYPFKIGV